MSSITQAFNGLPAFCHVYNTSFYDLPNAATFTFDSNNVLNGFTHTPGSDTITSQTNGVFYVTWVISTQNGGAMTFLQNGARFTPLSYIAFPGASATNYGHGIITINSGDTFKLRNDSGFDAFLNSKTGYTNVAIVFMQIGNHD